MRIALTLMLVLVMGAPACSDDSKAPAADLRAKDRLAPFDAAADAGALDSRKAIENRAPDRGAADRKASDLAKSADAKGEGWGITCGSTVGTGTASGTILGKTISTTTAGGVKFLVWGFLSGYGVAFFNQSGTCASLSQVVTAPVVLINLCTNKPGTYAVGSSCKADAGAGISIVNGITLPSSASGGKTPKATSGTITIDAFDPACGGKVKGSFTASFSGESLSGTFDTVGCGEITLK